MKIKYLFYNYPRNLIAIIYLIRNWYAPFLYKMHLCNNTKIYFRDGDVVDTQIPFRVDWDALIRIILMKYYLESFRVYKNQDDIVFVVNNDVKFTVSDYSIIDTLVLVDEQFREDYYRLKNRSFREKTVVDIGGNIGDTAMIFAKKGANVHSFEPIKAAFNQMKKNILLNNIQEKVHIYNVALSDHDEEREIEYDIYSIGGFSLSNLKTDKKLLKERIIIVEILKYLRENKILSCDIIKMDCEGSETVLLNDSRLIDYLKPHEVMVEYHKDNYGTILTTLNKKYVKVERVPFKDNLGYGMIYAENLKIS